MSQWCYLLFLFIMITNCDNIIMLLYKTMNFFAHIGFEKKIEKNQRREEVIQITLASKTDGWNSGRNGSNKIGGVQ